MSGQGSREVKYILYIIVMGQLGWFRNESSSIRAYACMHAYIHTYVRTNVRPSVRTYVDTYAYIFSHIFTHSVSTRLCVYLPMRLCVKNKYAFMYTCKNDMYTCIYVNMYVYICTNKSMYTC